MKKLTRILCLAVLAVLLMTTVSFGAEDFRIVSTYPADGAKNTTKDNMCVKVVFNTAVGNADSKRLNKNRFRIKDKKGTTYPTRIYYSDKNPKYALIVIDTTKVKSSTSSSKKKGKKTIQDDTAYICTIDKDFVDNNGTKLGNDPKRIINFRTMNQSRNTRIYMVMMVLMMVGMFVFSAYQMRQQTQEKQKEKDEEEESSFNPYKVAKRTGKTVDEVIAEHNEEVEKRKEKEARRRKRHAAELEDLSDPHRHGLAYRVSRPHRISEAGSTYKTGRKALYEKQKAEAEKAKAERKANGYRKKQKATQQETQKKGSKKRNGRR